MLMLSLDLRVGPGRSPLPCHLGDALHGFVERAAMNHAPHLLSVLRPNGMNESAHFMILVPPYRNDSQESVGDRLRVAVILYGTAGHAWPVLLRAFLEQQSSGLNNHHIRIEQAWSTTPDGESFELLEHGRLIECYKNLPMTRNVQSMVDGRPGVGGIAFYRLSFRSPLLLASRKAQRNRERLAAGLPRPTLASILNSIARRMRYLEPELAAALDLAPDWTAPSAAHAIKPLTPADLPARQIMWKHSATPRKDTDVCEESAGVHRTLPIPGIVGDFIYPVAGIEHEHALLYWGQWLGVGQKTTMGCGSFVLSYR